jgi:hypothetical protein
MFAIIEPVPAYPSPATTLQVGAVQVTPGASAFYQWTLFDAQGVTVGKNSIALTGDAYTAWGSDDAYLYTYTAAQLGLTIVEIVPDAPPAPEPPVVEPPEPVITAPPVLPDGAPAAPVAADPAPAPSNE